MLFDSKEAFKIRKHYSDLLVGSPFEESNEYKVTCVLVSEKDNPVKTYAMYWDSGRNEKSVLVRSKDGEKDLEIYVYCDNGDILFSELDRYLTSNRIEKIYDAHQS
jgi:hypothetical protein